MPLKSRSLRETMSRNSKLLLFEASPPWLFFEGPSCVVSGIETERALNTLGANHKSIISDKWNPSLKPVFGVIRESRQDFIRFVGLSTVSPIAQNQAIEVRRT